MSLEDDHADVYRDLQVLTTHFNRKFNRYVINKLFRQFDRFYDSDSDAVYDVIEEIEDEIKVICELVGITYEQLSDFTRLGGHEDVDLKF